MKNSIETYFVVSSNRMLDGVTVYLIKKGETHDWSIDIAEAEVFTEATKDKGLAVAQDSYTFNQVHEPYAIEVTGKKEPMGTREKIRAAGGPSIPYGDDAVPSKDTDYSI